MLARSLRRKAANFGNIFGYSFFQEGNRNFSNVPISKAPVIALSPSKTLVQFQKVSTGRQNYYINRRLMASSSGEKEKDLDETEEPVIKPSELKSELIETFLNLERLDTNLYRSKHLLPGRKSHPAVYGGQVIGQALIAASATVPDIYHPHSLHSYFIKAGDVNIPILYMIDRVRDGRSFCTRVVKAVQNGEAIYTSEISFHKEEPDSIKHQSSMPEVTPPDQLKDSRTLLIEALKNADKLKLDPMHKKFMQMRLEDIPSTFEARPVVPESYLLLKPMEPRFFVWVKAVGTIGSDVRLHHCVAAYMSDSWLLPSALFPHLMKGFIPSMMFSLDHSIWLHHHNFSMDQWMLYETDSPIARGSRAFIHGRLWSQDGTLVLSTAQEGLIRARL